ncbi:nucleotidyl transferase AbiEii/AbiGii toxin family protein [Peredibacter starrii]|uniref:Nucleotidyl transferase AbiEii/AbiGii toxin family protein n=1 Tax=Peredibacter starrii TaxID=28202 RepID=A0AAX4HU38_9BACT|nr:nucleotidyl transferase AbiEii/AbiGii toxin family protein [Peredibacter starrii]WPU66496.1 nucleotidyl transferase AbiEii/AbiGii toxin family protein [Peredibacter starrii]
MNEEQIKARLVAIAKDQKKTFNDLLKPLSFERLLARVAVSPHRSKLIFKGGLCLKQFIDGGRETIDIDFLIRRVAAEAGVIEQVFKEILANELDDSFKFSFIDCEQLDVQSKKYPGYRINIQVNLGKTKDRLQVDLGIGDVVDEFEMEFDVLQYKGEPLISQGGVSILAYPPEFIFSEKLQAIIDLGALNSRMKDYFDCHVLITKGVLDEEKVVSAIQKTFQNRKTELKKIEPAQEEMIGLWLSFQRKVPVAPKDISEAINAINGYLVKIGLV